MNEVAQIGMGIGAFLLIAVLVFVVVLLGRLIGKLNGVFAAVDKALIPFGQSPTGQLAHNAAMTARSYVDQPTDSAIIRAVDLLNGIAFIQTLASTFGVPITRERVALWGRKFFDALGDLTDGEPDTPAVDSE